MGSGNLINYTDAYNNYYAVKKETVQSGGIFDGVNFKAISSGTAQLTTDFISTFINVIKQLIKFEHDKELAFLTQYYDKYKNLDKELETQLYDFLFNEPIQLSKAFELIEIHRHKLQNEYDNIELNLEQWEKDYVSSFNNKFFIDTCKEAINALDNMGSMTPEQVLNYMIEYVKNSYQNEAYKVNFEKFMDTYAPALEEIVRDTKAFKGKLWNKPIDDINFVKKGEPNKTIQENFISKIVTGLVNGLGQEEFLVSMGGASTARATNTLTMFTRGKSNRIKTLNLPTETDVYMVLDGEFNINEQVRDAIAKAKTNQQIRDIIMADEKKDFIIHVSSKDLSIAESGQSSSIYAKLKGEGSLDSKINTLEQLGNAMGANPQMHELIFEAINSGAELLYSGTGTVDDVSRGLTSLTFGFMFEDFEEQIQQMNTIQTNNELHIYMITGQYFTISEILGVLLAQVEQWSSNPNKLITIGFKAAPTSYYEELKQSMPSGISLWNAVRDATIKNTMMKVMMNVTKLKDVLNRI